MPENTRPMAAVRVYTRPVSDFEYPAGLARSVHFACKTASGAWEPLNRNYGMLFAEGRIAPDNTIVPLGVKNPSLFAAPDGRIGILADRVHEDGTPDPEAEGKLLLWWTRDLIRFEGPTLVNREDLDAAHSSELEVPAALVESALSWWRPIVCTGVKVPPGVRLSPNQTPDNIPAVITYNDGSVREKKVRWDFSSLPLDRPGEYSLRGKVVQQSFPFPLACGYGDPVLFPWEGKWYYTSTNDNLNDIGLYVREADDIPGLFAEGVTEHLILPYSPERGFVQTFWAPEFHVIGGELWLLFAVSGHVWGPQCHMMKLKKGGRIVDPASWEAPIRVLRRDGTPLADQAITLDMTYLKAESGSYVVWSYREHIGTPLDSGSMLYIAPIDDREPWRLIGDPMLLSRPLYGWENVAGTINNEGPHALIRDGMVYLAYSGGSANRYTYVLGLLSAKSDSNLMDLRSWSKSPIPVLSFYSVKGQYGPGHHSFFVNEEGEHMIAYHAETSLSETLRCDGIRRVHFRSDGSPYFQMSAQEDLTEAAVETRLIVDDENGSNPRF